MLNTCYLTNGLSFTINPEIEENPSEARTAKKLFVRGLNVVDLSTEKAWLSTSIRSLATGLIPIGDGSKKWASKAILIERLITYINEERLALNDSIETHSLYAKETLAECYINPQYLSKLISTLSGKDLVDAVVASILKSGLAPSTTIKTVIPDVVKIINAEYKGVDKYGVSDKIFVISHIHLRFKIMRQEVDNVTNFNMVAKCHNRAATHWNVLYEGITKIFNNVETATWKELSIVIAFATGRRCAEVHGTNTVLSYVDDSHLLFKGQLKTKGRDFEAPYVIPVLYDAKTVLRAWELLKASGKIYSPEKANTALSKPLSTELPINLKMLKEKSGIKQYKDFRDSYAAKLLEVKPEVVSTNAYLSKMMGHGEFDVETAATYDKRYISYD